MRIEYLGDALDHFKGSVLRHLQGEGALRDLCVDPMATDAEDWEDAHYELYAGLLGVEVGRVVQDEGSLDARGRRPLGFQDDVGDLFLDPDIGVRPPSGSPTRCYVKSREVRKLTEGSDRVVGVYQHARRVDRDVWAEEVVGRVQEDGVVGAVGYLSRQVAMFFFSREGDRLEEIREVLVRWTGPRAEDVVGYWPVG